MGGSDPVVTVDCGCSHNKEELRKSCPNVFAVSSSRNVPSGEERGETDALAG